MAYYSAQPLDATGISKSSTSRESVVLSSGQRISNFHGDGQCFGERCPVHRPSNHSMRSWPLAFVGSHMVRIDPDNEPQNDQGILIPDYSDKYVAIVIDPDDYGYSTYGSAILRNSGICPFCHDHLESKSTHDFMSCSCGKSFVDGGTSYLRRTVGLIDTSIIF